MLTEILGYAAMAFLMFSFLLKDMRKLRMLNSLACALFVAYGILLASWPIVISNAFIILVNLYYLLKKD
ncbi:MAG: YgjV family protein [Chitinophagales bacterium]|nr:YgjV family protein [Bacteroidota bacterium]MCB9257555.1 YgjV family protein [Chitinophagales bacterium]